MISPNNEVIFSINPIGIIHSPYKEKFAIPRQPRIIDEAIGTLELYSPYNQSEILSGIEEFSHLWLVFIFHETMNKGWSNLVRPPRLGGNKKKGTFATRSTFRPNPIGISAVKFLGHEKEKDKLLLKLGGVDLLDKTPVIDIKPYIPYSDSISGADGGFAHNKPTEEMPVIFTEQAQNDCLLVSKQYPLLSSFISQVLSQDPRPAYKKNKQTIQEYAVHLYDFNIKWQVKDNCNHVLSVKPIDNQ
ncbi:tRNA (N6-threonylcarbamoyladenosine(37)-N6)-methyltransferase TrmO [Aliikangiella sp. IMCC44359]|uniref:tRNA (N6-threonylcarbamoyladenosine(37)-N6)-methyltransferase TrmO n=1 Tax=Aliikangiella sp. IMCC44359 TaxID=3459125 RepID=UPI00403A87AE